MIIEINSIKKIMTSVFNRSRSVSFELNEDRVKKVKCCTNSVLGDPMNT